MKTILVVDDEPHIRRVVQVHLERKGYKTLLAGDGREALELLAKKRADAILTDIVMPTMDGFQFLAELRKNPIFVSVPVIVTWWTMYNERPWDEQIAEAKAAAAKWNVSAIIPRPFVPANLVAQVDAIFQQPR